MYPQGINYTYSVSDFNDDFLRTCWQVETDFTSNTLTYLDKEVIFSVDHLGLPIISPVEEINFKPYSKTVHTQASYITKIIDDVFLLRKSEDEDFVKLAFKEMINEDIEKSQKELLKIYETLGDKTSKVHNLKEKKINTPLDFKKMLNLASMITHRGTLSGGSNFIVIGEDLMELVAKDDNFLFENSRNRNISKVGQLGKFDVFLVKNRKRLFLSGKFTQPMEAGIVHISNERSLHSYDSPSGRNFLIKVEQSFSTLGMLPEELFVKIDYKI